MASHTPAAILTKATGSVYVERGGTRTALTVESTLRQRPQGRSMQVTA